MCHHLWRYDKFNCLKWNSGRKPGAFKRIMTYTYLITVPLLVIFSVIMTLIKFKEGWIVLPDGSLFPKPVTLYSVTYKEWVLPLYFVLSTAWAFELVSHLEELMFWLFILHQAPGKDNWFSSWEFVIWCFGSIAAVIMLPMTAFLTREKLLTCDAWVILAGSLGSTVTTIAFLYVLWKFPAFLRNVIGEGIGPSVIVRLVTFYRLNLARVAFRLLFSLPFVIVSIDALKKGGHPVNEHLFWDDFLFMVGATGCFFSSGLTLFIFFPISSTNYVGFEATAAPTNVTHHNTGFKGSSIDISTFYQPPQPGEAAPDDSVLHRTRRARSLDLEADRQPMLETGPSHHFYVEKHPHKTLFAKGYPKFSHSVSAFPQYRPTSVHPYVTTFTSPIDLADVSAMYPA